MTERVSTATQEVPQIRRIGPADLGRALARGWKDYLAKPSHVAVLGVVYPLLGLLLLWGAYGNEYLQLIFPLISGFALLGPFAALIFYELSRRREQGEEATWQAAFGVFRSAAMGQISILALVLMLIFLIWLWTALAIYSAIMPPAPEAISDFLALVFRTPEGRRLIVAGCGAGFLFAVFTFAISVVSFPLLLDHHVNVRTAVGTSVRAVLHNPTIMMVWGLIVVTLLILGALPLLIGLAVVVPVLGHATWHLYRAVVVP